MASIAALPPADIVQHIFTDIGGGRCVVAAELPDAVTRSSWRLDFADRATRRAMAVPEVLGLRSSGTTGPEQTFWRHRSQIELEIDCIIERLRPPFRNVYCFAPIHHIFGLVCGLLTAWRLHACFVFCHHRPGAVPFAHLEEDGRSLAVTLPASWHILSRIPLTLPLAVLHSAGPIPEIGHATMRCSRERLRVTEILGSTETGAIAYRDNDATGRQPWTLLPDVELPRPARLFQPAALFVASPRCAPARRRPREVTCWQNGRYDCGIETDDLIELVDARQFHLLGRSSQCVKVNGLNVYLDQLEQVIEPVLPNGCSIRLHPARDPVRGEGFNVTVEAAVTRECDTGRLEQRIRSAIAQRYGATVQPRAFIYAAALPRTATGKIRIASAVGDTAHGG